MTHEEKRKELADFCRSNDDCDSCPMYNRYKCNYYPIDNGFVIADNQVDEAYEFAKVYFKVPEENDSIEGESAIATPVIKDSGNRTEFPSGAVRDMREGKGRCDLLPLDVVADIYETMFPEEPDSGSVFAHIYKFTTTNDILQLKLALDNFEGYTSYADMFLEVAKHFEEGAKKYGEFNWQKGIPVHCYIDSAVRHYLKYMRGDKDEPHDRAFCWNILCCIWTCNHKPELNDYATGSGAE